MRIWACLFGCLLAWSVSGAEVHFDFGEYSEGTTLTNFHTALLGGGPPPDWKIISADVPSGFEVPGSKAPLMSHSTVLAQTNQDMTDERYPLFIYDSQTFGDFSLQTRFEVVSGINEQTAGVIFRYQNPSNYYVVQVNILEKNISLHKMIDGEDIWHYGLPLEISAGTWHELKVESTGIYITCSVDGQKVLPTITDTTHILPNGKIGFWTKSDTVSYFSEATVNYVPLVPAAQQIVDEVVKVQSKLLGLQIYTLTTNNTTRVLASKDLSDIGHPGTNAELLAIQNGTVSLGWERGAVLVTLPFHDRNGEYIAAIRVKLKSFFGETQDNAVTRAMMIQKDLEQLCTSAENLRD
jgi:hypothetical protein